MIVLNPVCTDHVSCPHSHTLRRHREMKQYKFCHRCLTPQHFQLNELSYCHCKFSVTVILKQAVKWFITLHRYWKSNALRQYPLYSTRQPSCSVVASKSQRSLVSTEQQTRLTHNGSRAHGDWLRTMWALVQSCTVTDKITHLFASYQNFQTSKRKRKAFIWPKALPRVKGRGFIHSILTDGSYYSS